MPLYGFRISNFKARVDIASGNNKEEGRGKRGLANAGEADVEQGRVGILWLR